MSMPPIARVVMSRRPISLGIHILCQIRSTSIGSSPISSGVRWSMVAWMIGWMAQTPMPVVPSSVSTFTSRMPVWV
jgi:hypothetical protein